MATIYPFPRVRDRAFIRKQAAWLSAMVPATAERQLARQIAVQRETMGRRGIEPDVIEVHLRQIETAIRAEMVRFGSAPGGRA